MGSLEDSSDVLANSVIESTTTDYLRKPEEKFELITPVTRAQVVKPQFRQELIPTVSRSRVATLSDRKVNCESPVQPISQALRLRPFARR